MTGNCKYRGFPVENTDDCDRCYGPDTSGTHPEACCGAHCHTCKTDCKAMIAAGHRPKVKEPEKEEKPVEGSWG